jgi:hypothetical protein
MPLGPGVRYRMRHLPGGGMQRLAFKGKKVVEVKNMDTGKTTLTGRRRRKR